MTFVECTCLESEQQATRVCPACKIEKPMSEWAKDSSRKSGYHSCCKKCSSKRVSATRKKNRPYYRDYARRRHNEIGRKRTAEQNRARRQRAMRLYPHKIRARKRLAEAILVGKAVKPSVCGDCNREFPKDKIHGHHNDYSRPLDVEWLCCQCHTNRHRAVVVQSSEVEIFLESAPSSHQGTPPENIIPTVSETA